MAQPSFLVLVSAPSLHPAGVTILEAAHCRLAYVTASGGHRELCSVLASRHVDGLIARGLAVDATAINCSRGMRVISRHGAGYDNIDLSAANRRAIPVMVTRGTNSQSVAELAIGLMLAVARAIPAHDAAVRVGSWNRTVLGVELSGSTMGIVGYGRIGRATARAARGLGMRVVAFDPAVPSAEPGDELLPSLDALLARSDVVSLHSPLTPETSRMIDAPRLSRFRKGAILINTARAELIDEAALAAAIHSGSLSGAGLDMLSEPAAANHPFASMPNVVITPHVGGSTDAALAATAAQAATNLLDVLRGNPVDPANCVNPETLLMTHPERTAPCPQP
jgi:D-3-phosphoglycerate dehydrogenase